MTSPEEFYAWFRAAAKSLPEDVRISVLNSLDADGVRLVYLGLNDLWKTGKLPAAWGPILESFYSRFY
jgi:hypothetical protein